MAAPTIRIVAELAGVSVATVSRTLKHPDRVKPETRERVLATVAEVGYVPNAQARHFRRQTTDTVILLVRDIGNPFYLDIYKGVEEAAVEAGYKVLMGDARDDDARISHYLDMVRERHADGLIMMTGRLPDGPAALPPIVVALEFIPGRGLPTVGIDNAGAAATAVDHLVGLGHRRIAHVTGPIPEVMSVERRAGYRAALLRHGIPTDPALEVWGDYTIRAGREAARRLAAVADPPTAVFAANDEMAIGVISELRALGRRVPEDVSVVGFDDIAFAEAVEPPLTTVRQPRREIGRRAMDLMIEILAGETPPDTILMPTELVVRRSTAAPAVAALTA